MKSEAQVYEDFRIITEKFLEKKVTKKAENEAIAALEQLKDDLIMLQSEDLGDILVFLLYLYLNNNGIKKACQLIAEYNLSLQEVERKYGEYIPLFLLENVRANGDVLDDAVFNMMLNAEDLKYEDFYEIYLWYPQPEYAQIVIRYARLTDHRLDTINLSNRIKEYIFTQQKKRVKESYYEGKIFETPETMIIMYYANRLEDLSYIEDLVEIKKCVLEAKEEFDYNQEYLEKKSPQIVASFWTSMAHCLNILEEFERTIEIPKTIQVKFNDPLFYFYLAEAYYERGEFVEAKKYCSRSVAIKATVTNRTLLAQVLIALSHYDKAQKILEELVASSYVVAEDSYLIEKHGTVQRAFQERKLNKKDSIARLESPYVLLFMCYINFNDIGRANAFYQIMKSRLGSTELMMLSNYLLEVKKIADDHISEIEKEKELLEQSLNESIDKYNNVKDIVSSLTQELSKLQLLDESVDVTSEYWEENMAEKMDAIIAGFVDNLEFQDKKNYEECEKNVINSYPELSGNALKFFVSAEYMYSIFKGNVVVDFAPIMLEYCRVFETLIWQYFDKSHEYDEEIMENKKTRDRSEESKALGNAVFCIRLSKKKNKNKKLDKYVDDFEKMTKYRNDSAHKQLTEEEPMVKWIYEMVWKHDLIKLLAI